MHAEAGTMALDLSLANAHLLSCGRSNRLFEEMGGETTDETATFGTNAIPSPMK
jgi:hypothetical protein